MRRPQTKQIINTPLKIAHSLDELPPEVLGAIWAAFTGKIKDYENVYMVEVKLDDPMTHIIKEDEGVIFHNETSGSKVTAEHLFDEEWAVVHKDDLDWKMLSDEKLENALRRYVKNARTNNSENKKTDGETTS